MNLIVGNGEQKTALNSIAFKSEKKKTGNSVYIK
jgi:hypothetical protein